MKNTDFLNESIISHRGNYDNDKVPENSIKAFSDAIKNKYVIELDVHLTKDNRVVVFHDDILDRMTNKKGKIKDYYYNNLKNIKLLDTSYTIPLLSDVLKLVNGKVPLLIELKSDTKGFKLEKEVYKLLLNYNGKYAIQSFNPLTVLYFKYKNKNIVRGLLISKKNIRLSKLFIPIIRPDFLSVNKELYKTKIVNNTMGKIPIYAWSIDSIDEYKKYKDKYTNLICNMYKIK